MVFTFSRALMSRVSTVTLDLGSPKLGPTEVGGKAVGLAGEALTGTEYARVFSDVLGEPVAYAPVTTEVYRGFGFPGADDPGNMYQYYRDNEQALNATRDVSRSRSLNPALRDSSTWAHANAAQLKSMLITGTAPSFEQGGAVRWSPIAWPPSV